ncbi:hypothetical protein C8R42DRAFT_697251 [Lentinula raphanica]|nr:hypothetical protein C8R42DRAFT_697251 [Lentinula raphanica]KAJ3755126.1 hypothetical protein EV360DRAFT_86204 [Lentinula raphanica]KAJ3822795.1 hypothetical protein F5880DRAFT_628681 [Lentinula raphanica]
MLNLPQSHAVPVFAPSTFHAVNTVDDVDRKFNATHLYYKPHAVQIIQLVECSPPPQTLSPDSFASSSSGASSSYCSDEEEESECSSYCSSEEDIIEQNSPDWVHDQSSSDTYNLRMKRILAWREDFSSHLSTTMISDSTLKRKMPGSSNDDDDALSRMSKRSRSHSSRAEGRSNCSSLGALSCPACDASFDNRQDLRQHGYDARVGANEACIVAVDYAFE